MTARRRRKEGPVLNTDDAKTESVKDGTPNKITVSATTTTTTTNSSNEFRRLDESPRQVATGFFLVASLLGIAYYSSLPNTTTPPQQQQPEGYSFRLASFSILLITIAYTFLQARDGAMKRPHPGIWRCLHGCNLWYAFMTTILLVVRIEDGVMIMGWLFPGIERKDGRGPMAGVGANIVDGVVADDGGAGGGGTVVVASTLGMDHLDCQITISNLIRQIFGLWFFAHAVGWWAKMLMLRDLWTCLVYSTVFELVELTLQCWVPEFQECWWDSMILDWFVANILIGMNLGMMTQRILNWPAMNWANDRPWLFKKYKLMEWMTPSSWIEYNWNPENDPFSLVLNAVIWVTMLVGEVNSFFLINIFQLPRDHVFNILRQVFFCFTALPACEEWYEYTRHVRVYNKGIATKEYTTKYKGRKPRIGQSVWLLTITISLETAAIIKYAKALGLFSQAQPVDIQYWGPWAMSTSLFVGYFVIHCWFFYRRVRQYPRWLKYLKWSSALPLFLLCRLYAF